MDQLIEPPIADDTLDEQLAQDDHDDLEDTGAPMYVPDPRILWAQEEARAMIVVLTRRFGAEFAREVHNELASRLLSYQAGCPDDVRDGVAIEGLVQDKFWDGLFQSNETPAIR